jgi:hypothetical protein
LNASKKEKQSTKRRTVTIPTPGRGAAVIRVTIEKVHPLTGTATRESGTALRFDGWLGLLGVLSELLGAADQSGERHPDISDHDPAHDHPP